MAGAGEAWRLPVGEALPLGLLRDSYRAAVLARARAGRASAAGAPPLLLRNVRPWQPSEGAFGPPSDVLVVGDRIAALACAGQATAAQEGGAAPVEVDCGGWGARRRAR